MKVTVRINKASIDDQGIGWLADRTMVVVKNGRACVGKTVQVTITSVYQTNDGKTLFAELNEDRARRYRAMEV